MASEDRHGTVLLIPEIVARGADIAGESVRTIGSLMSFDAANATCTLSYKGATLVVDTSKLGPFPGQKTVLYQFIGEMQMTMVNHFLIFSLLGSECFLAGRNATFCQSLP